MVLLSLTQVLFAGAATVTPPCRGGDRGREISGACRTLHQTWLNHHKTSTSEGPTTSGAILTETCSAVRATALPGDYQEHLCKGFSCLSAARIRYSSVCSIYMICQELNAFPDNNRAASLEHSFLFSLPVMLSSNESSCPQGPRTCS